MHKISEHVKHRKVVLDDNDAAFRGQLLDDADDAHALVDVQVGGRLVEEIHVRITQQRGAHGHALQFTAGQLADFSLKQMVDAEGDGEFVEQAALVHLAQQVADLALDPLRQAIDVLWLDGHRNSTFFDLDEEVPQFATGQGGDDGVPIRLALPVAQIWHQAS